ncbi:DHH family protein, partial [Lophium mytilinum]
KKPKKPRIAIPDYHLTAQVRDPETGEAIWPAPQTQIDRAKSFIQECVKAQKRTLIVPDKDADGLTSGVILHHTLTHLGLSPELISVHLVAKGNNVHDEAERTAMASYEPVFIFVLDQGSRKAPPIIDTEHRGLIIDHHFAEAGGFPENAVVINACECPPVVTTSLLTYLLCTQLHPELGAHLDWLCAVGTHGDLGNNLKWKEPFPNMNDMFNFHSRKAINDCVSMINAPRRAASYDVKPAWDALLAAKTPSVIVNSPTLKAARFEVNEEVEKWAHTAPKFSFDGTICVLRINSKAQVHPVIATRWAGYLKSEKLEVVMCANEGYLPDLVNFSCRITRSARAREEPVDIIRKLRDFAESSEAPDGLKERLGDNYARGHKEASGGVVGKKEFEELMEVMRIGEKPPKGKPYKGPKPISPNQTNLLNFF